VKPIGPPLRPWEVVLLVALIAAGNIAWIALVVWIVKRVWSRA
jgi:hypothetical protein